MSENLVKLSESQRSNLQEIVRLIHAVENDFCADPKPDEQIQLNVHNWIMKQLNTADMAVADIIFASHGRFRMQTPSFRDLMTQTQGNNSGVEKE
jgi:hypothetical protein